MEKLGKENLLLLGVMLLSSLGAFSYFPYVGTALAGYLGMEQLPLPSIIAFGMLAGNILAYTASLSLRSATLQSRLALGYLALIASLAILPPVRGWHAMAGLLVLGASMTTYRFAIGFTANIVRTLQVQHLPAPEAKVRLFSWIKLCTSVGGALGPLLGAQAIAAGGFEQVLQMSMALFAGALFLLACIKPVAGTSPSGAGRRGLLQTLRSQPRSVFLISSTAMVHFMFEAQIYAFMSTNLKQHAANYVELIGLMFTANSLCLIVFTLPVMRLAERLGSRRNVLLAGSAASAMALSASPLASTPLAVIGMTVLFSIGEIVTPQILMDMVTDVADNSDLVGILATFNFMTGGVGMALGFALGTYLPGAANSAVCAAIWLGIYGAFGVLAIRSCRMVRGAAKL